MDYLAARPDVAPERISLCGRGKVGLIATLAGALSETPRATVVLGSLRGFLDAMADPLPQPLWAYAPHLLDVADVPQLEALHTGRFQRFDAADEKAFNAAWMDF